jgi:hypothetical protein
MTQTLKNLLVLVAFIVLVALGYYLFTQNDSMVLSLVKGTDVSPELLEQTSVFIEHRNELEGLTLDTALFTNPAFTSLRSYTTEIPEQQVGRTNIFNTANPVPPAAPVSIGH